MAQGRLIKTNFNGGEMSPLLQGRVDLDKYFNSCQTLENMAAIALGAATTRPGFKYIAEVKDSTAETRLIPFRVSDDSNYMLEFGDLYIRIYKDQARVGTVEIVTPYLTADLNNIQIAQSADTMYIACSGYYPRKLVRITSVDTDPDAWTFKVASLQPGPVKPSETIGTVALTPSAVTGSRIAFTATSSFFIAGDVGRSIKVIVSAANDNEVYYESRAIIGEFISDTVVRCDIVNDFPSTAQIPANEWKMTGSPTGTITPTAQGPAGKTITLNVTTPNEQLTDLLESGSSWWASSAGGNYYLVATAAPYAAPVDILNDAPSNVYENGRAMFKKAGALSDGQWAHQDPGSIYMTIEIDPDLDADPDTKAATDEGYFQYGNTDDQITFRTSDAGKYMYINGGYVKIISVSDSSVRAQVIRTLNSTDATIDWEIEQDIFDANDDSGTEYPTAICFYEDKLIFGKSPSYPQTFWGSATGVYERFPSGTADADSYNFTILSRELTNILWLEPRDSLFIGTTGGVWRADGGSLNTAITPTNISLKQVTTEGASSTRGISKGSSLLYIHEQGQKIMDVGQETDLTGKQAFEVSMFAEHITTGGISDLVYQSDPYGIVWTVRADGQLIGMTYLAEQNVVAFHRHVTDGTIESIAIISGSTHDELWLIVNRTIDGNTVRYIEVMQQFFLKSDADNLINAIHSDAAITVTNAVASETVSGLNHLEGETVKIVADGKVHSEQAVSSGEITLDYTANIIQVGMGYNQTLRTQNLETMGLPASSQGLKQRVVSIDSIIYKTMVAQTGRDSDNLDQLQIRKAQDGLGTATPLFSGIIRTAYKGKNAREASITMFNDAPTPMTISGIISNIEVGDA